MELDAFRSLVKKQVTASSSTRHHMIQPVQLALGRGIAQTVEGAFRRLDAWLEALKDYEPTTRRSYLTGMRDILRVQPIAAALTLDPAERTAVEERLSVLIKETSSRIYASAKASASGDDDDDDGPSSKETEELRLRVQLLEHAIDIISSVSQSCSLRDST